MKKALLMVLTGCTIIVVLFLMMVSVPSDPSVPGTRIKTGIVSKIDFNADTKDISIFLDDKVVYYINRGLEQCLDKDSLQNALSGKLVKITFYEPRFDIISTITNRKGRHVYKIESPSTYIFSTKPLP